MESAQQAFNRRSSLVLTVGTNHFGHFYLNHLIQTKSLLDKNAHITVTASSVHDPESPGGAQGVPASLGDLKGLEELGRDCEMLDGGAFNADKAYKDSKVSRVVYSGNLVQLLTHACCSTLAL